MSALRTGVIGVGDPGGLGPAAPQTAEPAQALGESSRGAP